MSRDILAAKEAISNAKAAVRGIDVLADLLCSNTNSNSRSDVLDEELAELLYAISRNLDGILETADLHMRP